MKTLLKRDTAGKTRFWKVKTNDNKIIVEHGVWPITEDSKIVKQVTVCKGKNIGKKNETTPEEQAKLEAKSKWVKRIERDDYHWDVEKAGKQLRPMLAHDYHKVGHRIKGFKKLLLQPKLDGLRVLAGRFKNIKGNEVFALTTRRGERHNVTHLNTDVEKLLSKVNKYLKKAYPGYKCLAIDGELYNHNMSLQTITSLARKKQDRTSEIEMWVFDLVIPNMSNYDRQKVIEKVLPRVKGNILPVQTIEVNLKDTFDEEVRKLIFKTHHDQFVKLGFEGLMVRSHIGHYDISQRSDSLMKYKVFFEEEFRIIDTWTDKNDLIMLKVEIEDGITCDVTPKRTHAERKQMLNEYLIGKWLTVKYQAKTEDGNLQFPVGLGIRKCDKDGSPLV